MIGIPRVLSVYRAAPFIRGYFRALGLERDQIFFSPASSASLWRSGCGHSATDPCFPVKVVESHVDHLLSRHARGQRRLSTVFLPYLVRALSPVQRATDCSSCPVVAASPALVRSWFAQACDKHGANGVSFVDPVLDLTRAEATAETLHGLFGEQFGVDRAANRAAVDAGYREMRAVDARLGDSAKAVLEATARRRGSDVRRGRAAVLLLARPYHADPGVHHHLGEELNALGYPLLGIRSLPRDPRFVRAMLASRDDDVAALADPLDIAAALPDSPNSGANEQVWAAQFAAAHGGLGVVDLTSFKCAQDATAAPVIDALLERAGVPTCRLHDFDETKPVAAMRLRLRTFAHAMRERGLEPWSG